MIFLMKERMILIKRELGFSTDRQTNLCYSASSSGNSTEFYASNLHLNANESDDVYAYYPYNEDRRVDNNLVRVKNIRSQYDVINRNTVQTRSNYVEKRDDRKIIHHAPNIIKGSPCKSAKP